MTSSYRLFILGFYFLVILGGVSCRTSQPPVSSAAEYAFYYALTPTHEIAVRVDNSHPPDVTADYRRRTLATGVVEEMTLFGEHRSDGIEGIEHRTVAGEVIKKPVHWGWQGRDLVIGEDRLKPVVEKPGLF